MEHFLNINYHFHRSILLVEGVVCVAIDDSVNNVELLVGVAGVTDGLFVEAIDGSVSGFLFY